MWTGVKWKQFLWREPFNLYVCKVHSPESYMQVQHDALFMKSYKID